MDSQLSFSCLSLHLLKFSYATVSAQSTAPIPWIHLSSKDTLFAIFENENTRVGEGRFELRPKLKVLNDPEVLEDIDLQVLAVEAQAALKEPNAVFTNTRSSSIAIIVRVPLIAIRYPIRNGQVRRFQVRFAEDEGYYEAMKILSRLKIPTSEAGNIPSKVDQIRPASSGAILTRVPYPRNDISSVADHKNPNAETGRSTDNHEDASWKKNFDGFQSQSATRVQICSSQPVSIYQPLHDIGYNKLVNVGYRNDGGLAQFPNEVLEKESDQINRPEVRRITNQQYIHPRPTAALCNSNNTGIYSNIDMYTPRPSTAPAAVDQHLSQVLPPRRELPFVEKPARKTASKEKRTRDIPDTDRQLRSSVRPETPSIRDDRIPLSAKAVEAPSSQEYTGPSKKRPAPKNSTAKTPAGKRVRKTAAQKRAEIDAANTQEPVPSVEDLLRLPQGQEAREQRCKQPEIGTKLLMHKVEVTSRKRGRQTKSSKAELANRVKLTAGVNDKEPFISKPTTDIPPPRKVPVPKFQDNEKTDKSSIPETETTVAAQLEILETEPSQSVTRAERKQKPRSRASKTSPNATDGGPKTTQDVSQSKPKPKPKPSRATVPAKPKQLKKRELIAASQHIEQQVTDSVPHDENVDAVTMPARPTSPIPTTTFAEPPAESRSETIFSLLSQDEQDNLMLNHLVNHLLPQKRFHDLMHSIERLAERGLNLSSLKLRHFNESHNQDREGGEADEEQNGDDEVDEDIEDSEHEHRYDGVNEQVSVGRENYDQENEDNMQASVEY